VLRERAILAQDGAAFCFVTIDASGAVEVSVQTRGVTSDDGTRSEHAAAEEAVRRALGDAPAHATDEHLAESARLAVRRVFRDARGIKPLTVAHVRRLTLTSSSNADEQEP
jgi:mRNA degradation ribonuclease J1/J2